MQSSFDNAARYFAPEDILTGRNHPVSGSTVPGFIEKFHDKLVEQQARTGHEVGAGFVFGSALARKQNSSGKVDMYIAIPGLIEGLQATHDSIRQQPWPSRKGSADLYESVFGYDFPVESMEGYPTVAKSSIIGRHVVCSGLTFVDGDGHSVGLIIGEKTLNLKKFLELAPAPVLAVGMTLGDAPEFAWHKDFPSHLAQRKIVTPEPAKRVLHEAARDLGMELVTVKPHPRAGTGAGSGAHGLHGPLSGPAV